ncbi:MAG: hypothetical protein EOM03_12485, partial [Clostridia bacterium]|nr:hypothetical protein [Clostridia bacterium]
MGDFQYTAKNSLGETVTGTLTADNRTSAIAILEERRLFPLKIADKSADIRKSATHWKVKPKDVGIMYGQRGIATMLDWCSDIRELAKPNVLMLNYGTPNAMLTWAANEYADSYAPYAMRFIVRSLRGRDDEDSARSLDADLALLPSYTVNWAAALGSITPAGGMLTQQEGRFNSIPSPAMDLVTHEGEVWG